MNTPGISLHIEKLIVDGLPGIDSAALETAVQSELARLLSDQGISPSLNSRPHIDAGAIDVRGAGSERIGAQVARATHGVIGGSR